MTDERLRAAERGGDGGDLLAEARLLVERVRAGTLPAARLELLARLGDPRGRLAAGLDALPDPCPDDAPLRAFEERLAETIAWCTERVALALSPRQVLRSRELRPERFEHGENDAFARLSSSAVWFGAVERVARARRARLDAEGWVAGTRARSLVGGRLLFHEPRLQLTGPASTESEELFDVDFMPPWDSWVAWIGATERQWRGTFEHFLVAWIPGELVPLVDKAIAVSPTPTLVWELDDPYVRTLRGRFI